MKTIEPWMYNSKEIFDEEIKRFFNKRLFVDTIADIPEIDCYRSLQLGDKCVTVRRTSEGIRAFNNVCLHRSSILDPIGTGKRSFRCVYHGWRYGCKGELTHAPYTDMDQIEHRQLQTYPLSIANGRIFAGLSGKTPDTTKVSSALRVCGLDSAPTAPFFRGETLIKCNWKQLFESVAENYHLNFVHKKSFKLEQFGTSDDFEWGNDGYVFWHKMTPETDDRKMRVLRSFNPSFTNTFRHAYIFPNLFAANTQNVVGFHNRLTPLAPGLTLTQWSLYDLPMMLMLPSSVQDYLRSNSITFSLAAQDEDRAVIESCGIGITHHGASIQLQPIEGQLRRFHEFYQEEMRDVF